MFNVKINENEYSVFEERELNIIGIPNQMMIGCPNYYDLEIIAGERPLIRFINNKKIITYKQENQTHIIFEADKHADFGLTLSDEEYKTLYKLHLKQLGKNPTPEYQNNQKIKQDIEIAKQLIKKEHK